MSCRSGMAWMGNIVLLGGTLVLSSIKNFILKTRLLMGTASD